MRAYYHMKSADWKQNTPFPLKERTASEWAKLPRYYVMDLDKGMAETVAPEMPSAAAIAACKWLPDDELKVYSAEYGRTGFRADFRAIASGGSESTLRNCKCFLAARSMCPHFSLRERAIGVFIKTPETWRKCRIQRAPECWGYIW